MRLLAIALIALGAALMIYGWWGIFTASGQAAYQEMAGLIPFYGGITGALLAVLGAGTLAVLRWRSRRVTPSA